MDKEIRRISKVIGSVGDLVRFEPRLGLNGDIGLSALGQAYIVEDSDTAQTLAPRYPECHFLVPTGEHYHHRLVSGGKGAGRGPLTLRREFRFQAAFDR